MVVAFYFRLHLAYFPRPVVAIFARPEQYFADRFYGGAELMKPQPYVLNERRVA